MSEASAHESITLLGPVSEFDPGRAAGLCLARMLGKPGESVTILRPQEVRNLVAAVLSLDATLEAARSQRSFWFDPEHEELVFLTHNPDGTEDENGSVRVEARRRVVDSSAEEFEE